MRNAVGKTNVYTIHKAQFMCMYWCVYIGIGGENGYVDV